jgi:hypothetical protein
VESSRQQHAKKVPGITCHHVTARQLPCNCLAQSQMLEDIMCAFPCTIVLIRWMLHRSSHTSSQMFSTGYLAALETWLIPCSRSCPPGLDRGLEDEVNFSNTVSLLQRQALLQRPSASCASSFSFHSSAKIRTIKTRLIIPFLHHFILFMLVLCAVPLSIFESNTL